MNNIVKTNNEYKLENFVPPNTMNSRLEKDSNSQKKKYLAAKTKMLFEGNTNFIIPEFIFFDKFKESYNTINLYYGE